MAKKIKKKAAKKKSVEEKAISLDDWFQDSPELDSVAVEEFETFCAEIYSQKDLVDHMKANLALQVTTLEQMKKKIMAYMESFNKTQYSTNLGLILVQEKFSVKVPKDPDEKEKFFAWLEEKGIKEKILTVASATLNSLYNEEFEAAEDPDFKIPGIAEPKGYKTLKLRGETKSNGKKKSSKKTSS